MNDMDDLISRSVAIEEIWNVFNSYVNDNSKFDEYETEAINMAFIVLQNRIKEQPTAYDVEKVVAELESAENYYYDDTLDAEYNLVMFKSIRQDVAIDIVRKGGIDETIY